MADAPVPWLQVVRGDASPEEIAALVVTLSAVAAAASAARAGAGAADEARTASAWTDRSRLLRAAVRPAPGGWRRSALPC